MKTVYIVHGYNAHPHKHWFPWLRSQLNAVGIKTPVVALPRSDAPELEAWLSAMQQQCQHPDENTFFVAHSLGCVTTLRYLQQCGFPHIGGIILVSGFYEPVAGLEILNPFTVDNLEFAKLRTVSNKKVVISAADDPIVALPLSQHLAVKLGALFLPREQGGHFMQDEGFTSMPLVLQLLSSFIPNANLGA